MVQIYFLTELFLLYSAALLLSDTYGTVFLSLINLRNFVYSNKKIKNATLIACGALIVLNVFLPIGAGPMLIGDFLPVITLLMLLVCFFYRFSRDEKFIDIYKKYDAFGYIALGVAVIHLLFPKFVIL